MKNILVLIAVILLSCKENTLKASDNAVAPLLTAVDAKVEKTNDTSVTVKHSFYQGTLNKTTNIRLYINEQEQPCGGDLTILNVMYKYDSQEEWIFLNVTTDRKRLTYCMVEDGFSGALFLEKSENVFIGQWISPDTKKQFDVVLEKVAIDPAQVEKLEEILFDVLIYGRDDC